MPVVNGEMQTPTKKLERRHFGTLLSKAWSQSATADIGSSGFRASGIYPFQPSAAPEHAFLKQDVPLVDSANDESGCNSNDDDENLTPCQDNRAGPSTSSTNSKSTRSKVSDHKAQVEDAAVPSTSSDQTPTKLLNEVSPIPNTVPAVQSVRKQLAELLTTLENIDKKEEKRLKAKKRKAGGISNSKQTYANKKKKLPVKSSTKKRTVRQKPEYSTSEEDEKAVQYASSTESESFDENECVECFENYNETMSQADWIQCSRCTRWLHETCTLYGCKCNAGGKFEQAKKEKGKKIFLLSMWFEKMSCLSKNNVFSF